MTTTYAFDDPYEWKAGSNNNKGSSSRNRKNSSASSDNGSLTYSVATSICSNHSTNAESQNSSVHTETSSFENIIRVLDNEDVASYFQRELELQQQQQQQHSSSKQQRLKTGISGGSSSTSRGGSSSVDGNNSNTIPIANHYYTNNSGRSVGGESLAYSNDTRTIRSLTTNITDNDELTALHGADYCASVFTG